ncbi:MAG: SH3 domain-containing protein, partial [Lachnospiraceae bacterium]|nr:SH3 domain-containing protein [Lachnospiraceae bacterium]
MGMNHKTADKTLVQEFVDAVNESETELAETISTEEEEKEEAVQTTSTEETNNTEASDDIAESDDTEETTQVIETEESTETEEDFQTSVGFPSTEIYDEAETEEETGTEIETEEETTEEAETETQEDAQDFSGLVIARVSNYVNVRSMPSEEGEIVGKLYDKSVGEFIEEKDGWYKITSGSCTGYVKGEYCVVGEEAEALAKEVGTTYAIVNTTTLKVRQEASTESSVLGLVPIEEELVVVEELDGWVKIAIEEGDGYVSRDYVTLRTDFVRAESREEEEARLAKEAQAREEA